jgi:hypothetical protein
MCNLLYNLSVSGDCTNSSLGGFTVDITGTAPDYSIQWVSPASGTTALGSGVTTYTIENLSAGTYTFNIIDSCEPVNTIQTVNVAISSGTCVNIIGQSDTTCGLDNGSISASTTNYYGISQFYLYETTLGYITSGTSFDNTYEFIGILPAGVYYVVANDGGGCTGKTETTIIKSTPQFDFGLYVVNDAGCAVESGKIYVTGQTCNQPYTYLWFNGSTNSYVTGLTEGTYSVTVTDAYGCSLTKSGTVEKVEPVGLGSLVVDQPECFQSNGTLTITLTGGTAPYYFSGSNGTTAVSFSNDYTFSGLGTGIFSYSVTDAGLCKFSGETSILTPGGFTLVSVGTTNTTCGNTGGSINPISIYGGSGNYTYTLLYPDGHSIVDNTTSTTWQFDNLSAGTYTLTIADGVCTFSSDYVILNNSPIDISVLTTGTTCNQANGSIEITVTGGTGPYLYQVSGQAYGPTNDTGHTFTSLLGGNYTVSLTDSTGCVINQPVIVQPSYLPDFVLVGQNNTNGNNGSISAYITNGEPEFTWTWSNNVDSQTGLTVTNLSAGTYTLTVTDSYGCVKTKSQTITGPNTVGNYLTYNICDQDFENSGLVIKKGLREMLWEGYNDLTSDDYNCVLNQSIFEVTAIVGTTYMGLPFYTGTTLSEFPSDNQYYDAIDSLLTSFPGIGSVVIDSETNSIKILSDCNSEVSLSDTQIELNLKINYDISCVACNITPTPTPSLGCNIVYDADIQCGLTPTPTVTKTPTRTPTPTYLPIS